MDSDSPPPPAADPAPPASASAPATAPSPDAPPDELDTLGDPLTYTPEEYRWVPVRRHARRDGWTEEKQRRFIEVLADTGQVGLAARAVGMTAQTAYRLRRSAKGAAFARAWDAARHHAGSLLEDIAFERAVEGVEQHVYDGNGDVVATRRIYNDRLLRFLLTHLKPERYGTGGRGRAAMLPEAEASEAAPALTVEACLRALEPPLPAPPETMLDADTFAYELDLAHEADGTIPHFLSEQRPPKSKARLEAEAQAAREAREAAAYERSQTGETLSDAEFKDMCCHLDPGYRHELAQQRYR